MLQAIGIVFLRACPCIQAAGTSSDIDRVTDQLRQFYLGTADHPGASPFSEITHVKTTVSNAAKNAATLREDGSWANVAYAHQARSSWPAYDHLMRTYGLVLAARDSQTDPATRDKFLAAAHRALAFWIKHDFLNGPGPRGAHGNPGQHGRPASRALRQPPHGHCLLETGPHRLCAGLGNLRR